MQALSSPAAARARWPTGCSFERLFLCQQPVEKTQRRIKMLSRGCARFPAAFRTNSLEQLLVRFYRVFHSTGKPENLQVRLELNLPQTLEDSRQNRISAGVGDDQVKAVVALCESLEVGIPAPGNYPHLLHVVVKRGHSFRADALGSQLDHEAFDHPACFVDATDAPDLTAQICPDLIRMGSELFFRDERSFSRHDGDETSERERPQCLPHGTARNSKELRHAAFGRQLLPRTERPFLNELAELLDHPLAQSGTNNRLDDRLHNTILHLTGIAVCDSVVGPETNEHGSRLVSGCQAFSGDITLMRIEAVSSFIMHVPVTGNQISDSTHTISHWGVVGARIRSSDGIEGFGFTGTHAQGESDRLIARLISELYAPLLVGRDLEDHQSIWQDLFHFPPLQWVGRAGLTQLALSAVDVALWDLRAKHAKVPLWSVLGGSRATRIRAYNTDVGWLSLSRSQLVDMCVRACQEEGFTGIKIKVGQENPDDDVRRVEEVRKAVGPDITIAVDANGKFDLPTASLLSRRLEPYDVTWFEEPMWYDDVEAHAQLARLTRIPIALGEQIYTVESLCQFMLRGAVQFVQPDVTRIGGVTPFLRAIASASAQSLQVAPHAGEMSQVHVHIAFHSPSCSVLEYIPWIRACFLQPATVRDGYFVKPEAPGAGTTPAAESLERYGKPVG